MVDAIRLASVTKTYRVGVGRARVREMTPPPIDRLGKRAFPRWWARDTFDALDDVTLSVSAGSSVGIVGHNGAGKTTMLKVIAGVTAPTSGATVTTGRVAALIDVVVGLHPELTGRENIYLLGAMHGYGRRAMRDRMDRVVAFAETSEDLLDTPLKRFSAGMITRVGFGAVTALDPEVLLIDEVLAVGDAAFQRKCATWLEGYRADGGTLLFVSHNLSLVRNMTERVVWLDHGHVVADGDTSATLLEYGRAMERREVSDERHAMKGRKKKVGKLLQSRGMHRWGMGGARIDEVHVDGFVAERNQLDVRIVFEATDIDRGIFCLGFIHETGTEIGVATSPVMILSPSSGEVGCTIQPLPLRSGIYFPVVAILSEDGIVRDRWQLDRAVVIERSGDELAPDGFGPVDISASWAVDDLQVVESG